MIKVRDYLHTAFPGLTMAHSLYHQWGIRIHFELGDGIYQFRGDGSLNLDRFDMVYSQALSIFNSLFSDQDDLFLVTNVYENKPHHTSKVYQRYIKNKDLKFLLKQETFISTDEEDEGISQFCLPCRKRDIRYPLLIQATCNEDFSLKPKLGNPYSQYPDVYFINATKHLIFFIYDDRGCEVIANDKETLRPVYEKYNEWVSEYNRKEIEAIFK
ncbi:DUF3885 domain-containing protein [Peribacillus muralis]|uniref:DUF3885 domain-containing protein n=1 Tax=Peribacillus muralis TaxID=264697 RepID=UPI003CFCDA6B